MTRTLLIGSRGSKLALTQSNFIAGAIRALEPDLHVEVEIIHTKGDKILDAPLAQIGGKGLFTKELEVALQERRIHLAVHSLKDLPTELPNGLTLASVPKRESPYDAFVCTKWDNVDALPANSRVGTSSLRRGAQLRAYRSDLEIVPIRGNVETRLRKVEEGEVEAAVLACAGLNRLSLSHAVVYALDVDIMIPAPAQGALGIEARADDAETLALLSRLSDPQTVAEVRAERACLATLEGGCQVPLGASARLNGGLLELTACVCSPDGTTVLRTWLSAPINDAESLGVRAAEALLDQGAGAIIAAAR